MLNSLDVIIIVVIMAGAYLGYSRGVLAEIIALIGVVLGISLASHFYLQATEVLLPTLRNEKITSFIAFLILYGAGVLAFFLVHLVVKSNMAGAALGPVSRIVGAIIGALKSTLFVVMVIFLVIFFWGAENSFTSGTMLLPRVLPRCQVVVNLLPDAMQVSLDEYLADLSVADENGED
ncbi:MAG: CvpA family protein [Pseudomonadota bacterium]|nr:CvpA family protein [Pseudomonadota bacterium]